MDTIAEARRVVRETVDGLDVDLCVVEDSEALYHVTVTPRGPGAPFAVYAEEDYLNLTVGDGIRFELDGRQRDVDLLRELITDVVDGGATEFFLRRASGGGRIGAARRHGSSSPITPLARLLGTRRDFGPYQRSR